MNNKIKNNSILHLIENNNDSYEELKLKNQKLREIIIKISEELKSLNTKYNTIQKEYATEKKMILDKLDKITNNYKIYAEGYKEKSILKKDINNLIINYKQNNKVLNSFKDSFLFLLKKNMYMYYECKKFDIDIKNINNNYEEYILEIKNSLLNQIIKFKKSIDMINFPDFYKEYLNFVENEEKEMNNKNKFHEKYKSNLLNETNKNYSNSKKNYNNKKNKNEFRNFGKINNKYSFTKIDLNLDKNILYKDDYYNENNNNINIERQSNNKSYKESNFYKNYLSNNNINYSNYGDIQ